MQFEVAAGAPVARIVVPGHQQILHAGVRVLPADGAATLSELERVADARAILLFDLGADLPVEAFVQAVRTTSALSAVGVSVTSADCLGAAAERVQAVREAAPGVRGVVGGHAVTSAADAERLGAEWAADAKSMAQLLG